ncbi:hypothetical protein BC937DRAFT_94149 [Endogone sp. FLAS-F59071]|nr:hypothetical protein BC937DRAFT_94149 [Endogone sp. FLAS-F59071]|eukprot:RUS20881.1 hypothetical protein BC937DRAFT_94149 [Endogone sp. FLAS-F59071]
MSTTPVSAFARPPIPAWLTLALLCGSSPVASAMAPATPPLLPLPIAAFQTAPQSDTWFESYFTMLVKNANPSL